ncbi:hypothetical protein M413DRAFT_236227 [Hebeloma cylindrosporum]|uniref:Uncharacterized protein n=1 Tax=Hebeloma cylindrosporum TaxID=76867 RepID=A0A0C2XNA0_HEBCY|nr:hypothetical protein M413DRAFT_236227 [Hebeloma cylindrosporum h7]
MSFQGVSFLSWTRRNFGSDEQLTGTYALCALVKRQLTDPLETSSQKMVSIISYLPFPIPLSPRASATCKTLIGICEGFRHGLSKNPETEH